MTARGPVFLPSRLRPASFAAASLALAVLALLASRASAFAVVVGGGCVVGSSSLGFVAPPRGRTAASAAAFGTDRRVASPPSALRMSEDEGGDDASPKKRRRKRKDGRTAPGAASAAPEVVSEPEPEPEPEPPAPAAAAPSEVVKDKAVRMEVVDVRDVVSGKAASASSSTASIAVEDEVDDYEEEEEEEDDDDDDEYEWVYVDDDGNEVVIDETEMAGGGRPEGLEALLADAKKMRAAESPEGASSSGVSKEGEEEGFSVSDTIRNVISTIVTADFFVVIGLLLWFLAGIFCSYVLKDDGVQIAFNNIFEPVVQPALGVLMIASAAGAAFNKDEEEE